MGQDSDTTSNSTEAEPPVDVSAAIAAQVFGDVPLVGPDWLRSSIAMQANFAQLLPGAAALSAAELNGSRTRAEREEDEAKSKSERMMNAVEEVARQREEWARTSHSFGTTTMTGAEWKLLSADLKDGGALHQWLIARLMKDGKTEAQAEHKADEIADVTAIMAKPKLQRTPAEEAKMKKAEKDPEFQRIMPELAEQRRGNKAGIEVRGALNGDQATSTTEGADLFASAPDLTRHHRAALVAEKPLDLPRGAGTHLLSREPAPVPAASAGLDL